MVQGCAGVRQVRRGLARQVNTRFANARSTSRRAVQMRALSAAILHRCQPDRGRSQHCNGWASNRRSHPDEATALRPANQVSLVGQNRPFAASYQTSKTADLPNAHLACSASSRPACDSQRPARALARAGRDSRRASLRQIGLMTTSGVKAMTPTAHTAWRWWSPRRWQSATHDRRILSHPHPADRPSVAHPCRRRRQAIAWRAIRPKYCASRSGRESSRATRSSPRLQ